MDLLSRLPIDWHTFAEAGNYRLGLAGLVFASVFLLAVALLQVVVSRNQVRRRAAAPVVTKDVATAYIEDKRSARAADLMARIGSIFAPKDAKDYSQTRLELVRAGLFSPRAVPVYQASRLLLGLGLPLLLVAGAGVLPVELSMGGMMGGVAMLAALGFIAPSFYVQHRRRKMQIQFRSGFPDFMDLLVVCVESGLSLQVGIDRISRELAESSPQLAANLHLLGLELRAGSALKDALDGLSQRLDIQEARSLGMLLKQSEELGTSLTASLRVYSDEMRDKRLMRAEALAQALPVKITFPVGFCIFPVMLVMLFLPLIIRIKHAIFN